ncbi:MAG: general secretion pathway protein GspK [Rhodobiaceae bacterium]|nr:general secretion pathway protein GspK [Hyphomonas sp.]MCB9970041.1 general secretion pathway protein GspK [Hyphomonas sp.]MCC0050342.1 general secretion pathway protein GspK [Rhodobiaceae bacterium]
MTRPHPDHGFVLPSVLAFVLVAMLIAVIGANALDRARDDTLALSARHTLDGALDDLEAQVVYVYMTGTPVQYGVAQQAAQTDATAIVMGDFTQTANSGADTSPANLWRADGGVLGFQRGNLIATARYQDTSGLISLNSSDPLLVAALLRQFGASDRDARPLAAALADFVDDDDVRRPQGGERADYRLRQLADPTNSPIRDLAELPAVLGWDRLGFLSNPAFVESVTLSFTSPEPRWVFSPDNIASLRESVSAAGLADIDVLAQAASFSSVPGARARFTLTATDRASGQCLIRIVEIERQVASAGAPFSRLLVFEKGGACSAATTPLAQPLWTNLLGDQSDGT